MTAALRLPSRFLGYLFVFLSLLPLGVSLHQLMMLGFDLLQGTATPLQNLLHAGEMLAAAGLTALALRQGMRRLDP